MQQLGSQIPIIPLILPRRPVLLHMTRESHAERSKENARQPQLIVRYYINAISHICQRYQRWAFERCTDNKRIGSLKAAFLSLWCGRSVHRREKEEIFYKYGRTLNISTVIKRLCPWIHTVTQTESRTTFKTKARLSTL